MSVKNQRRLEMALMKAGIALPNECRLCHGEGEIRDKDSDYWYEKIECPVCRGEGFLWV